MDIHRELLAAATAALQQTGIQLDPTRPVKVQVSANGGRVTLTVADHPKNLKGQSADEAVLNLSEMDEAILNVLAEAEGPLVPKEITGKAGYSLASTWRVRERLHRLAEHGRVKKERDGWVIA